MSTARLHEHFAQLTDPRRREVTHPLINIVTIAVCAVIAGADDFVAIAKWGRTKREWLARFLDLSAGIPSHDRFNAVFAALRPAEFEKCLLEWITAQHDITQGQLLPIDGKTLRRSFDTASGKSAIHMASVCPLAYTSLASGSATTLRTGQRSLNRLLNECSPFVYTAAVTSPIARVKVFDEVNTAIVDDDLNVTPTSGSLVVEMFDPLDRQYGRRRCRSSNDLHWGEMSTSQI